MLHSYATWQEKVLKMFTCFLWSLIFFIFYFYFLCGWCQNVRVRLTCRCESNLVSLHLRFWLQPPPPGFAEILPSKQHPLQWLPSWPCKKESINIPVTPHPRHSFTEPHCPLSVNAASDHTSFSLSLALYPQTLLGRRTSTFISVNYCPLLAMSGSSNMKLRTTEILFSQLHSSWESVHE